MAIILWNKKYCETLSETLLRFRDMCPRYAQERVTYAGRLDPLAEGLMILLTGHDVHRKEEFLGLEKEYTVSFIFGVQTDSYDILGIPSSVSDKEPEKKVLVNHINELKKITEQIYPVFSSKTVQGKTLFNWFKEGKIAEITLPKRSVSIHKAAFLKVSNISQKDLQELIQKNINAVHGDFRQEEITAAWELYFVESQKKQYGLYLMQIGCSSGTYIRTLIHDMGVSFGLGACSLKITRISVGPYKLDKTSEFQILSV